MKTLRWWTGVLLVFAALGGAAAASEHRQLLLLDLANSAKEEQLAWPAGSVVLMLKNTLPDGRYDIRWVVERQPIGALALPELPVVPIERGGQASDACDALDAATNDLAAAIDEKGVAAKVAEIERKRAEGCQDPDVTSAADKAIHSTLRETHLWPPLRTGESGVLAITRVSKTGATESWTRRLNAPASGRWLTSYGFNFLEDDNEEFTAQAVQGSQGEYAIAKDDPSDGLEFKPAVFFTWIPMKWDLRSASFGLTGGLDFDGDSVSVFAGGSVYVGDNIHLALGLAVRQVTRLRGEYEPGQIINQQLAGDQLAEKTYSPGLFAGIGFRFDKSPFSKSTEAKKEAPEGATEPAESEP